MMAYPAEVRELTFKVWYGCGLNDSEASRLMDEEHDYAITRQTIAEWREKYGWEERATRMDVAKQQAADNILSLEEDLFESLKLQKERYDRYFEKLGEDKVDTQAMYAYTQLCKQLKDLHKELKATHKKPVKSGLKADSVEQIKREILGIDT